MAGVAAAVLRLSSLSRPTRAALGLLGLSVLAACAQLLAGRFYAMGDMRDVFIPLEQFFSQELREGRLPAWQPDIAWGYPVIAAAQIGFFYPPLLLLRALPLTWYLPLLIVLHLSMLGVGMYAWLRQCGRREYGALFGALAFVFSGFVWQHLTHLNIFLAVAWLPWQLWLARRLASRQRFPLGQLIAFIVTLAVPFLAGQLQVPLLMAGFSSLYLLYEYATRQRSVRRPLITVLAAAVIAFALVSAQLLPTLEMLPRSSRGPEGDFDLVRANQHSFPLYHMPSLLFPRFFGHDYTYWGKRLEIEYGAFIGTLPLLLAAAALPRRREPAVRWWGIVALVSFLLALGSASPFRLIGLEPSLWLFSAPARWLLLTTLAGSALAAYGFDVIAAQPQRATRYLRIFSILFGTGIVIGNAVLLIAPAGISPFLALLQIHAPELVGAKPVAYYADKLVSMVVSMRSSSISLASPFTFLPLVAVGAALALHTRRRGMQVLIGLTAIELLLIAGTTNLTLPWSEVISPPPTLAALPVAIRQREARLFSIRPAGGDTGAYFTDPASRATPATRAQLQRLLIPLVHSQFGVAGVEWPASLDIWAHYQKLERLRGDFGYVIQDPALAYDLNIGAVLAPANESGDPPGDARVVGDISIAPRPFAPRAEVVSDQEQTAGSATYEPINPRHVRFRVIAEQGARLVVRDSWYPGWQATVDGQPAPIEIYHDIFRAVAVPAGQHVVEMHYVPVSLYRGLVISLSTVAVLLVLVLNPRWRRFTV